MTEVDRAREVLAAHGVVSGFQAKTVAGTVVVVEPSAILAAMLVFAAQARSEALEGVGNYSRDGLYLPKTAIDAAHALLTALDAYAQATDDPRFFAMVIEPAAKLRAAIGEAEQEVGR